jgi:S1-C subfamily serine protease
MKKLIVLLFASASLALASNTTINATMDLMEKGMNTIQKGFFYNSKALILEGIEVVDNANKIFETVDTKEFTKGNRATQVISNIHGNLAADLKVLRKTVEANKFGAAAEKYGKVLNDCTACHSVIRGW